MIFLTLVAFAHSSNGLDGIPITSQNAPFFILIFAIALILILWFWKFCVSHDRGKFEELSDFLDGKASWNLSGFYKFAGIYKKTNFTIDYVNGESYLQIKMDAHMPFSLTITRETVINKLIKTIGLDKETEIGNTFFDSQFHIFTNDASQAQKYLSSLEMQKNIKDIFEAGFSQFKIIKPGRTIPGKIKITSINPYLEEDFKREKILMTMEAIYLLTNKEIAK